ncbi:MAG: hypothetical protein Q7S92_05670 [Candidatus Diapherotrites archaeon]|nr:hypothetical protein [Candidatus Diapherotrites archaeon]
MANKFAILLVLVVVAVLAYVFVFQPAQTLPVPPLTFTNAFDQLDNIRITRSFSFAVIGEQLLEYSNENFTEVKQALQDFKTEISGKKFVNEQDKQAILELTDLHLLLVDSTQARYNSLKASNQLDAVISNPCPSLSLFEQTHAKTVETVNKSLAVNAKVQAIQSAYPAQAVTAEVSNFIVDEQVLQDNLAQSQTGINQLRQTC